MATVTDIQHTLGVPASGHWDATTHGALLAYQQSGRGKFPMSPSGHPDAATLANLGYYQPATDLFTDPWSAYLAGTGERPGHFARDLRTSIDQVPRWVWGTLAASFSLFAYLAYRTDKKRGG